jgi:hypothetical protein
MNSIDEVAAAWDQEETAEKEWEKQVLDSMNIISSSRKKIAILGGSGLLESTAFSQLKKVALGDIIASESDELVFISRHSCSLGKRETQF